MCINACKSSVFPFPFKKMPTWHLPPTQGLVTLRGGQLSNTVHRPILCSLPPLQTGLLGKFRLSICQDQQHVQNTLQPFKILL